MALPAEQGQLAVPVVTVNKVFKGTAEKSPTGPAEENEIRMLVPQGLQVGETYLFFRTNGLAGCSGAQLMSKMAHNSCQSIFMHINRNSPEKFSGL